MAKKIAKKTYSQFDMVKELGLESGGTKYKPIEHLEFTQGLREATNMLGIPLCDTFAFIGGSDTGKTTSMKETIKCCLDSNQFPIYIDKEGKFNYGRAMGMGLPITPVKCDNDTGEIIAEYGDEGYEDIVGDHIGIIYEKPFIVADDIFIRDFLTDNKNVLKGDYKDKDYQSLGTAVTANDVFNFMEVLITKIGKYLKKYDFTGITFLIDSYDRLHTDKHYEALKAKKQVENRFEVQSVNKLFMNFIENTVKYSKSVKFPYYVTLGYIVNKYTYQATPNSQATAKVKGGDGRKHYTDIEIYFGGKLGTGITKPKVTYKGQTYTPFTLVQIEVLKNHGMINPKSKDPVFIQHHSGVLCVTKDGIIPNTTEAKDEYKKNNLDKLQPITVEGNEQDAPN